jgi:head-tail adaptor
MRHLLTQTATIIRPTPTADVYGDTTHTGSTSTTAPCWLHVRDTDEEAGRAVAEHAEARLMLPVGTDIRATDRVTVGGDTWHVIGPPVTRSRPMLGASHIEVDLRRRS